VIRELLDGRSVTFDGEFDRLRDAVLAPPPARRIPILVAGTRPRMLRLTARYADAWNTAWYGEPDDRFRPQLDAFESALAAEGRDPGSVERTVGVEVRPPADASGERAVVGEAVLAAVVGPSATVTCGQWHLLNRVAQGITQPLGAGHIDGASGSSCTVPATTSWVLATAVILIATASGHAIARRRRPTATPS